MANPLADSIRATAIISVKEMPDLLCVFLLDEDLKIKQIRKKEGRLKSEISYQRKGDSLFLNTYYHYQKGAAGTLFFEYKIPLAGNAAVEKTNLFTAFNLAVFQSGEALGEAGKFYPAVADDASFLSINLTIPETENAGLLGTLSFKTDNEDGTVSQFWDSFSEYSPERFYLIVGQFEEFDKEEISQEFGFVELDLEEFRQAKKERELKILKEKWHPFISFYEEKIRALSDSEFVFLDSISEREVSNFFIKKEEVPNANTLQTEQNIALYLLQNDTVAASEIHFQHQIQKFGERWKAEVLEKKWANFSSETNEDLQRKILKHQLEKWRVENADWLKDLDSAKMDTGFMRPLLSNLKFPSLKIRYQYIGSQDAQRIYYAQDTAVAPLYFIPAKAELVAGKNRVETTRWLDSPAGFVEVPSGVSPQYVSLSFGAYFPGTIIDKKPDSYNLYQLSNAQSSAEKHGALEQLFLTENRNLFSTVLGIALADENPAIRRAALERAGNLDFAAQQKLKGPILKLAKEDSDAEIRKMAEELKNRYYQ